MASCRFWVMSEVLRSCSVLPETPECLVVAVNISSVAMPGTRSWSWWQASQDWSLGQRGWSLSEAAACFGILIRKQCWLCRAAPEPPTSQSSLWSLSSPLPKGIHVGLRDVYLPRGICCSCLHSHSFLDYWFVGLFFLCPIRVAVLSYQHHPKWQKPLFHFIPGIFLALVTLFFLWIAYNDLFFLSTSQCVSGCCRFSSLKIFMKVGREWRLPSPWHVFPASWSGYCEGKCITR